MSDVPSEPQPVYCPCPFCSVFSALRDVSPQALGHLTKAAVELAAATRALVTAVEDGNRAAGGESSGTSIEHITIT
jgi:hypothetical protein